MPDLILASSSRYRAALLARLGMAFSQHSPDIDESPLAGESAGELVDRLGAAKARAVAAAPGTPADAVIIASDQVCDCGGLILGKPGGAAAAEAQLATLSGRTVTFHTSLAVLNTATGTLRREVDTTVVHMRRLEAAAIAAYVAREQPFDCAGAFKSEGLGAALFERIDNTDPSALIGLPLIRLCALLREEGLDPLSA